MPQRNLFDLSAEPWEIDDRAEELVATVMSSRGRPANSITWCPTPSAARPQPGCRVRAPFGSAGRLLTGYCVRVETRPAGRRRLKALQGVIDSRPLLSPAMLRLTRWIAEHYLCGWPQVLEAVVPAGVRFQAGTRQTPLLSLAAEAGACLAEGHSGPERNEFRATPKQAKILNILRSRGTDDRGRVGSGGRLHPAPIQSLRKKGLIRAEIGRLRQPPPPSRGDLPREANKVLNAAQQTAVDAILGVLQSRQHKTILIHGVTGSGKTEVYIQAIQQVVAMGRQAIGWCRKSASRRKRWSDSARGSTAWPSCTATSATPNGTGIGSRSRPARCRWSSAPQRGVCPRPPVRNPGAGRRA